MTWIKDPNLPLGLIQTVATCSRFFYAITMSIKTLLFVLYSIPWAFLAMWEDLTYGSMFIYALWAITICFITKYSIKNKAYGPMILGNIVSLAITLYCINQNTSDRWLWYFKPFTAKALGLSISIVAIIVQAILVLRGIKKQSKAKTIYK